MKGYKWLSLLRCVLAVSLYSSVCLSETKPRIAIFPFDDKMVQKKDMSVGAKVADLLMSKLTANGAFTIYERQNLEQLLKEKNIKYDSNFDSSTAAKSGLLGTVDFVVYGQVDGFDANTKDSTSGKGVYLETNTDGSVSLKVTVRIVSVERGSVLAAPTAHDDQSGNLYHGKIVNPKFKKWTHTDGLDTDQAEQTKDVQEKLYKLVDQAAEGVTNQLAKQIVETAEAIKPSLPTTQPPTIPKSDSAATVDAPSFVGPKSGLAYIDQGSDAGIKKGQHFILVRSVDTGLKNKRGEPLLQDNTVCNLAISIVNKNSAAGRCIPDPAAHGPDGVPLVGDKVVPAAEK